MHGDHVMISQPSRMWPDGKECTLDTAALINRPDLVIAEKFGERERKRCRACG